MSISDSSKVDFLWKKVLYGVGKTDSSSAKSGSNETISSPLPVFANQIWAQAGAIPSTPPTVSSGVVMVLKGASRISATKDTTSALNTTWLTSSTDWVPATFNANYSVKVYAGDPQTTGTQIFPDTNSEEYVFDYSAGTLTFANSIPASVVANGVYIVGYRYVGTKGLTGAGGASKIGIVADIAARDAQSGQAIGDMTFVTDASSIATDAGPGEYAMYMWTGSSYTLISSQDSASADSKTTSVVVPSSATGTIALSRAGNGSRIVSCTVEVTSAFDGTFDLSIGQTGNTSWVMGTNDHDVKEAATYYITSSTQLSVSQETQINIYVTGTATVGSATVTLTYA